MHTVLQSLEIYGEVLGVILNNRQQYELIKAKVFTPGSLKTLNSTPSQEGTSDGFAYLHVTTSSNTFLHSLTCFEIGFSHIKIPTKKLIQIMFWDKLSLWIGIWLQMQGSESLMLTGYMHFTHLLHNQRVRTLCSWARIHNGQVHHVFSHLWLMHPVIMWHQIASVSTSQGMASSRAKEWVTTYFTDDTGLLKGWSFYK